MLEELGIDKYELIAETMKLSGNSAYEKTVTNKELCFDILWKWR